MKKILKLATGSISIVTDKNGNYYNESHATTCTYISVFMHSCVCVFDRLVLNAVTNRQGMQ